MVLNDLNLVFLFDVGAMIIEIDLEGDFLFSRPETTKVFEFARIGGTAAIGLAGQIGFDVLSLRGGDPQLTPNEQPMIVGTKGHLQQVINNKQVHSWNFQLLFVHFVV